jgi:Spy/CpxP family protein refolding chaperone
MKWLTLGLVLFLVGPESAAGQNKSDDAFARALFDPQLVLRHAQDIGLTAAQRRSVLDELKSAQTALVPLQVDMTEPALELSELLEGSHIDEAKAMAKIDQVLRIENEVKKRQAAFVIRVKNILTPEQQAKLRVIRDGETKDGGPVEKPPVTLEPGA